MLISNILNPSKYKDQYIPLCEPFNFKSKQWLNKGNQFNDTKDLNKSISKKKFFVIFLT